MTDLTASVATVGRAAERVAAEARRALGEAGVTTRPYARRGEPEAPVLVFYDELSPAVCKRVAEASDGGRARVVAVACERSALGNGGAWSLVEAGAADVFAWNDGGAAADVAARLERWAEVDRLATSPRVRKQLVGGSAVWHAVLRQVVEAGRFTDAPVLVTGESGTGKELVARLIHDLDPRPRKADLVILDCTTIVPTLSGSEFFGHERGAFTGAIAARDGAFGLADGGTLFLDEVGELPLGLQAELLRVVQEGTYKRVGSNTWRRTSFRLVCATNKDLLAEAADERFRRDFYYRIAAWTISLPSLRERREDVLPLARHFLRELREDDGHVELDESVREFLVTRDYAGNVRDLRHLVARMSHRHVGPGPITLGDLPDEERAATRPRGWRDGLFDQSVRLALELGAGLKEIGSAAVETAIAIAVADAGGNLQRASERLGVTVRALQLRRAAARQLERAPAPDGQPAGN